MADGNQIQLISATKIQVIVVKVRYDLLHYFVAVESGLSKALLLVATVSCILIIIIIIFTIIPILYCYCYYRKSTRHTGEDIIPINAYTMEQEKLEEPAHSYTTII